MTRGLMLIDGSNWGFAAASTKRLSVGDQDTNAVFGFIRRLRESMNTYPMLAPICLSDGISWRYDAFAEYKGSRGKEPVTKTEIEQARVRTSYKSQVKMINQALELLGIRRMFALNLEADDLAAILCRKYSATKRIILMSGDKDWLQLVSPTVSWIDLINDRRIGIKTFGTKTLATEKVGLGFVRKDTEEWIGISRPDQWADVKALMGDTSDEIGGVGGIGEKGAIELVREHGSVAGFLMGVNDKSIDVDSLSKKLRDFAQSDDKQHIFRRNAMLMDLNSPAIPEPNGLKIVHKPFDEEGFHRFCSDWMFQSILTDFEGWCEPFKGGEV